MVRVIQPGPGQDEQAGPGALQEQSHCGDAADIEFPSGFEKEAVAGHGIIDARAGENEAVIAAKGRDHDGDGHDKRPRAVENGFDGSGCCFTLAFA